MTEIRDAIDDGADAALTAIQPFVEHVDTLSDQDRERWWSGFMIAVNGMIRHSVGADMALLIASACAQLSAEEINDARAKS